MSMIDYLSNTFSDTHRPAFPSVEVEGPPEQPTGRIHWHGVTREEFFAAFALAGMCANGRAGSAMELGEDAREMGRAAVTAFDDPMEEREPPETEAPGMDPREATLEHLLDVANMTDNDLVFYNVRKEIERRLREAREDGITATGEAVREEFIKIRDVKGELETDAALETIERFLAGAIPVPGPEREG